MNEETKKIEIIYEVYRYQLFSDSNFWLVDFCNTYEEAQNFIENSKIAGDYKIVKKWRKLFND